MKRNSILIVSIMAACMAMFVGCEEPEKPVTDYREAWVGTYVGNSELHRSSGNDYTFDTIYTNQSLTVAKSDTNALTISYFGNTFNVECNENGEIPDNSSNPHSAKCGNFKGDSLFFNIYDVTGGTSMTLKFRGAKQ